MRVSDLKIALVQSSICNLRSWNLASALAKSFQDILVEPMTEELSLVQFNNARFRSEDRVGAEFHLQFEELESGIGVSKIVPGYFGRTYDRRALASSI